MTMMMLDATSVLAAAVVILSAIVSAVVIIKKTKGTKTSVPPDTVCLYQVGRGPWTPSLSPFPLKLETFLRMTNIPYLNDHSGKMSKKGKTPWMTYNQQIIADSQFCIEFLKQVRGVDADIHLTHDQRAVSRAFRELTEENLYWTMCYETFVKNPHSLDVLLENVFPRLKTFLFKTLMGWVIKKELWGQGIGRHSDDEIWDIGRRDLTAISEFLGQKPFMMGDNPSEVDCAVFGMLAMVVWQMKGSRHEELVYGQLSNLVKYCERMKDRFWPDWTQRCKGDHFVDDQLKVHRF